MQLSFDWFPLAILIAAGIAWLWHVQVMYLKRHRQNEVAVANAIAARELNIQAQAEEIAAKVHDRKSYNRLCDRFDKATEKYAASVSPAGAARAEEIVEVLQKAIDIVEDRCPGTQHSGLYEEPDDWLPRS